MVVARYLHRFGKRGWDDPLKDHHTTKLVALCQLLEGPPQG